MKKRNLILTAALFAMTASLAACGGQKPAQTQPAADTAAESKGGDKKEEAKEEPKSEETAAASAEKTRYEKILESGVLKEVQKAPISRLRITTTTMSCADMT